MTTVHTHCFHGELPLLLLDHHSQRNWRWPPVHAVWCLSIPHLHLSEKTPKISCMCYLFAKISKQIKTHGQGKNPFNTYFCDCDEVRAKEDTFYSFDFKQEPVTKNKQKKQNNMPHYSLCSFHDDNIHGNRNVHLQYLLFVLFFWMFLLASQLDDTNRQVYWFCCCFLTDVNAAINATQDHLSISPIEVRLGAMGVPFIYFIF